MTIPENKNIFYVVQQETWEQVLTRPDLSGSSDSQECCSTVSVYK